MSTTDDTVYDARYGADETAYTDDLRNPTRDDVVREYGTGADGVTPLLDVTRRLERVMVAGKRAGLLDAGPSYSRTFREYVSDAHHACTRGDARGTDYWTAHAAYVLTRATGDDWRPEGGH